MSTPGPRTGPCSPWCSGADIAALPAIQKAVADANKNSVVVSESDLATLCATAADAASFALYERTGRIFTGACGPVKVRPVSRPTNADSRAWAGRLSPMGWFSAWGLTSSYGMFAPGVRSMYGNNEPPSIELGAYPVIAVTEVKIDGTVIPTTEYELRNNRTLVRLRPTADYVPTERWGWPVNQIQDIPDTENGTFSVTFTFGQTPPRMAWFACTAFAEVLALPKIGSTATLPQRLTSVSRQGLSVSVTDAMELIDRGLTGIYEVDAFITSVNPLLLQRQAVAWSPDVGRPRRTPLVPVVPMQ